MTIEKLDKQHIEDAAKIIALNSRQDAKVRRTRRKSSRKVTKHAKVAC